MYEGNLAACHSSRRDRRHSDRAVHGKAAVSPANPLPPATARAGDARGTIRDFSPFREGEFSQLAGQLELTVRRTSSLVDRLAQEKDDTHKWIADISHQLKTPLTGLTAYLDLLEQTENDAGPPGTAAEMCISGRPDGSAAAQPAGTRAYGCGAVELHLHPLSLDSLLHDAVRAARPHARTAGWGSLSDQLPHSACAATGNG